MDKLAIDIALLPPDAVMDKAIQINKRFEPSFNLNKNDRLPHITILQAIINKENLSQAKAKLKEIALQFSPLKLKASPVNEPSPMLEVSKTKDLNDLHHQIMDKYSNLISYEVEERYFYDSHIRQKSLEYVRNFLTNAAYDNYYPHITLGTKLPVSSKFELEFTAKRLVICHLGNYNTCRQILAETKLGS